MKPVSSARLPETKHALLLNDAGLSVIVTVHSEIKIETEL